MFFDNWDHTYIINSYKTTKKHIIQVKNYLQKTKTKTWSSHSVPNDIIIHKQVHPMFGFGSLVCNVNNVIYLCVFHFPLSLTFVMLFFLGTIGWWYCP